MTVQQLEEAVEDIKHAIILAKGIGAQAAANDFRNQLIYAQGQLAAARKAQLQQQTA